MFQTFFFFFFTFLIISMNLFFYANELALIIVNLRVYRHLGLQCCNRTIINNANKT